MDFDYSRDTRGFYRDSHVAQQYHEMLTDPKGWQSLRFRFIAAMERRTVQALLAEVAHDRILDIPAGTGKMAPVFAAAGAEVMSCDISPAMLELARETYSEVGHDSVGFAIVDLEEASSVLKTTFDVSVCIRLMHRVPDDIKLKMLRQLCVLSPFAIVSVAVQNSYHDMRRSIRRLIFGGADMGLGTRGRRDNLEDLLRETHTIMKRRPVARGLSAEWIYLLKSRPRVAAHSF